MVNEAKAARLRAEAAKAIALAGELKADNDLKLQLMEIAQKYEWLAQRIEKGAEPVYREPTAPIADTPREDIAAEKPQDDTEPKA